MLTEKLSGVPVAVIRTPYIDAIGTKAGWLAKRMPRHPRAKHRMGTFYSVRSVWQLKRASLSGSRYRDYFQAGKSVGGIHAVQPAGAIVRRFADAARARAA